MKYSKRPLADLLAGGFAVLAATTYAATPPDMFDRELAAKPDIGKVYVRSFKAGVRIPAAFRGEWSSDPATCGAEGDDLDTRILVGAVTVAFSDETHVVTRVKTLGQRSLALTYGPLVKDYHYMIAPPVLSLSSDGKTLRGWDASRKEPQGRWKRCPRGGR